MFAPSQWADPTFLTFVKEYWEFNFREKYKHVTITVVFYIVPDNAEVLQDILVHFEVAGGQVTPRLLLGKKMAKTPNAIFFAGNPAQWRTVAQTGSVEPLQGRAVIPDDNFKVVKGEVSKTFFAIGNRVADRMAQGAKPSIDVRQSIRYDEPSPMSVEAPVARPGVPGSALQSQKPAIELLDGAEDIKIKIGGIALMGRKELYKISLEAELKILRELGPKKMDKYWKKVEEKPVKENYRHIMNVMELPLGLVSAPNLRGELLALQGKKDDRKEEFAMVEGFLNEKLTAATAAVEAEKPASTESASSAPAPTEPTTVIEFPLNLQGAQMTCHIDFKEPVLVNSKDQLSVVKCVVEKLDLVQNFQFLMSGMEAFNRQKMRDKYLNEELDALKGSGHKKLDKYWKHVESLPSKETFELGKSPFGLIFQLMATPTLRSDLLAMRGKTADSKAEYDQILAFLEAQLKS